MNDKLKELMKKYMDVTDEEMTWMLKDIPLEHHQKGTILLNQGEPITHCYFVLDGLVRLFSVDEKGKETTYQFYMAEDAVALFNMAISEYTIECLEDSTVIVGDLSIEQDMYEKYPLLAMMTRKMMEENFGDAQASLATHIQLSPEERYLNLLDLKPSLIERVPMYQIASYLGITAESLSRIRKRLKTS